jgi:hypothetical protein
MNADIDPINNNLEIVSAGCVDEYYNRVNLRLGHLIIESPERKRKIRNFTNECISRFLPWESMLCPDQQLTTCLPI